MTLVDFPNLKTMVALDGNRRLARARHVHHLRGWSLKASGFCWTDPRARQPNAFGIVQPEFLAVRTKREARAILEAISQ